MAHGVGQLIQSSDFSEIYQRFYQVFGPGSGSTGYGQQYTPISVVTGNIISTISWSAFRTDMIKARQHQIGQLITESSSLDGFNLLPITKTTLITEQIRNQYNNFCQLIENDKYKVHDSQLVEQVLVNRTRQTAWNNKLTHTIKVSSTQLSYDNFRYFFNAGGRLDFNFNRAGGPSTHKNAFWQDFLNKIGIISLNYDTTSIKNSTVVSPNVSGIGFYELTTSDQLLYSAHGTGDYQSNYLEILAKVNSTYDTITFTVTFADDMSENPVDQNTSGYLTSKLLAYVPSGKNVSVPGLVATDAGLLDGIYQTKYSSTINVSTVTEGMTSFITVACNNPSIRQLYWTTTGSVDAYDFEDDSIEGILNLSEDGIGVLARVIREDKITEPDVPEFFTISFSETYNGPMVCNSGTIYIQDTSVYTIGVDKNFVNEGDTVTYTLSSSNYADGRKLYITFNGIQDSDLVNGFMERPLVINNGMASGTVRLVEDRFDAVTTVNTYNNYLIAKSIRFNGTDGYFSRTPSTSGDLTKWTVSVWLKRCAFDANYFTFASAFAGSGASTEFGYYATNKLYFVHNTYNGITTNIKFDNPDEWVHVMLVWDSNNTNAADRQRIYINGIRDNNIYAGSYPAQGQQSYWNKAKISHQIGGSQVGIKYVGYMADFYSIDGKTLDPSSFGSFHSSGQWIPIKYTGTYGTNGFYLDFSDASSAITLGYDRSGNGNNWTPSNISVSPGINGDSVIDTPTNKFAVLNAIEKISPTSTISKGNLVTETGTSGNMGRRGTIPISYGKFYWEVQPISGTEWYIGLSNTLVDGTLGNTVGGQTTAYAYGYRGEKLHGTISSYGSSFTINDIIGVAFDATAGTLTFYKNGVSQGVAFTGISGTYYPAFSDGSNVGSTSASFNFGQRPFAYTPPTGFMKLSGQDMPLYSYIVPRSLMFNGSTDGLTKKLSNSDRKTWTWAGWVKRQATTSQVMNILFASNSGGGYCDMIGFDVSASGRKDAFIGHFGNTAVYKSNMTFFDTTQWCHIVAVMDTTNATMGDRFRLYVNGAREPAVTSPTIVQNTQYSINYSNNHAIGRTPDYSGYYFGGKMADVYFIDGKALGPENFGQSHSTTGKWIPKKYTGTYGINGFYLSFNDNGKTSSENTGIGKDYSGNGNYWQSTMTTDGISTDTPLPYTAIPATYTVTTTAPAFSGDKDYGQEKFFVEARIDSPTGKVVAKSIDVIINDTSPTVDITVSSQNISNKTTTITTSSTWTAPANILNTATFVLYGGGGGSGGPMWAGGKNAWYGDWYGFGGNGGNGQIVTATAPATTGKQFVINIGTGGVSGYGWAYSSTNGTAGTATTVTSSGFSSSAAGGAGGGWGACGIGGCPRPSQVYGAGGYNYGSGYGQCVNGFNGGVVITWQESNPLYTPGVISANSLVTYKITTTRIPNGTVLYIVLTGNITDSDIVGGRFYTVTVNNNAATGQFITGNLYNTSNKAIKIEVHAVSHTGPQLALSQDVNVIVHGNTLWPTPGTYSYTVPNGITSLHITAVGGGAGGTSGSNSGDGGTGGTGGGSGAVQTTSITVKQGDIVSATVGVGGSSGGGDGGTSYVTVNGTRVIQALGATNYLGAQPGGVNGHGGTWADDDNDAAPGGAGGQNATGYGSGGNGGNGAKWASSGAPGKAGMVKIEW